MRWHTRLPADPPGTAGAKTVSEAISTVRAFTGTTGTGSLTSPDQRHAVCRPVPCNRAYSLRFIIIF